MFSDAVQRSSRPPLIERVLLYVSLLKARPMTAVIYSAVIGYLAAASQSQGLLVGIGAILCIAAGGGGSAALNMWFETDVDAQMARTRRRATVSGNVKAQRALLFGTLLCVGSAVAMYFIAGGIAALMLCLTMGAYFGLYTVLLKRWTPHSVTIGGALAGVLTPLTGWVAATGQLDATGLILFGFVFFWTPPHVWGQALYRVRDYAQAGIPMMPVRAGQQATTWWIVAYTLVHAPLAVLPTVFGEASIFYAALAVVLGIALTGSAIHLARGQTSDAIESRARVFFRLSIAYLMILLTALALDRIVVSLS